MTTITFDGTCLVADMLSSQNGRRLRESKVHTFTIDNGFVATTFYVALCGSSRFHARLLNWLKSNLGEMPSERKPFPQAQEGEQHLAVVAYLDADGKPVLHAYESDAFPEEYQLDHMRAHAFGSGSNYASGAMVMGATAVTACKVAIMLDIHSGLGYEGYNIHTGDKVSATFEPDWNVDVAKPVVVAEEVDE